MNLRRLAHRWLALVRKDRLDRELDDEVLAHLELAERDAVARGLTPEEARLEARRAFGGIPQMKERSRSVKKPPDLIPGAGSPSCPFSAEDGREGASVSWWLMRAPRRRSDWTACRPGAGGGRRRSRW